MKIKQSILFVLGMLLISATYAQGVSNKSFKTPVIIAESGIKHITASSNIDLLLINVDGEEDIKASIPKQDLGKVKVVYSRGTLSISTKGYLNADERIPVYVYVDRLQSITLTGNAFARSRDILDCPNLQVNIEDDARVAIKSRGKVKVNAPEDYKMVEEERYHLLLTKPQ